MTNATFLFNPEMARQFFESYTRYRGAGVIDRQCLVHHGLTADGLCRPCVEQNSVRFTDDHGAECARCVIVDGVPVVTRVTDAARYVDCISRMEAGRYRHCSVRQAIA